MTSLDVLPLIRWCRNILATQNAATKLITAVVDLILVERTADAGTHVLVALVIMLTNNRTQTQVREVGVQHQLLVVVNAVQNNSLR